MKGFYIFEDRIPYDRVSCLPLSGIDSAVHTSRINGRLSHHLTINALTDLAQVNATCDKSDTYDFETGALIALMKMCGVDKVKKAAKETFFDVAENSAKENEYEEKIHALEEENKHLKEKLVKRKKLFNGMSGQFSSAYETKVAEVEKLEKENEVLKAANCAKTVVIGKLLKDYDFAKSEYEIMAKKTSDLTEKVKKLEEENEKLKLDCGKLQHGYNVTDAIFCGRRRNGKQFTALVEMFKRIDQKKVDAAYKEAYGSRVVWCSSQPSTRDELLSLLEASKYVIPSEFTFKIKPLTKREQMWEKILSCGNYEESTYVEVKKEDLSDFFKEAEEHKIFSTSGNNNLTIIYKSLYSQNNKSFTFQIFRKPAGFVCCNYLFSVSDKTMAYLPPMRWDLFKKGRLIVRITADNVDEFLKECEKNCKIKMPEAYIEHNKNRMGHDHGFIEVFKSPWINKEHLPVGIPSILYGPIHFMTPDELVRNQKDVPKLYNAKKIVEWEDVR